VPLCGQDFCEDFRSVNVSSTTKIFSLLAWFGLTRVVNGSSFTVAAAVVKMFPLGLHATASLQHVRLGNDVPLRALRNAVARCRRRDQYVAEIRYAGVAGSDAQLGSSTLYADREQAFEALVKKVRRLPELLKEFEVVVGKQVFQDVELAAQSIAGTRPMSDDVPLQKARSEDPFPLAVDLSCARRRSPLAGSTALAHSACSASLTVASVPQPGHMKDPD